MTHLLERHHHCQRVNQEQRPNQKPTLHIARTTRSSRMLSYHSRHSCWQYKRLSWLWMRMETRLANGVINRWTLLLTLVKGNRIHLLSRCKSSRSRLLTLCEGSRRCLVFLRSRSTVTMKKRRFFAAESFVFDQEHDERVWATLDEGCNAACHSASWAARAERYFDMFGFQSEYREGTRNKVFTGLGWQHGCRSWTSQVSVCTLPSLLNVATSITCQALLSHGSCLVMDLSCSRSMRRPS